MKYHIIETLFIVGFGCSLLSLVANVLPGPRRGSNARGLLDLLLLGIQGTLCLALSPTLLLEPLSLSSSLLMPWPAPGKSWPIVVFLGLSLLAVLLWLAIGRMLLHIRMGLAFFFLDIMPGSQMQIDRELNNQSLTLEQARKRRLELQGNCDLNKGGFFCLFS